METSVSPSFTYKEYQPSKALEPYVKCYSIVEYHLDKNETFKNSFMPYGGPYLGIPYKGWLDTSTSVYKNHNFNKDHLAGQILSSMSHLHSGNLKIVGVFFKPTGIHRMFGFPMHEFTQKAYDTEEIFGVAGKKLINNIIHHEAYEKKIEFIEKFFLDYLSSIRNNRGIAEIAIGTIQNNASRSIDQICHSLKSSPRNLRRIFKEKVGIGTKSFLRMCRFHLSLKLKYLNSHLDIQDLVYQCGYYDQSHFIRDFKQFSGKTPHEYFNKNNPNIEAGGITATY